MENIHFWRYFDETQSQFVNIQVLVIVIVLLKINIQMYKYTTFYVVDCVNYLLFLVELHFNEIECD